MHEKMKNIKNGLPAERPVCKWGEKCKYKYKCMGTHPGDDIKPKEKSLVSEYGMGEAVSYHHLLEFVLSWRHLSAGC